jgi:alkylhydroperoxidase family enzyme
MQSHIKSSLVETENWDPSLDFIIKQMNGAPLNVHKLLAKHPRLLAAWWNFRNYSVEGGDLGRRCGELVILRVASYLKSWYEWSSHVDRSLKCGLKLSEIKNVNKELDESDWSKKEFLLLSAVDQLIAKKRLDNNLYRDLRSYFSDKQIMDIVAIHGMYIILGCMINIWGLTLEDDIAQRLPESITETQFLS